MSVLAVQGLRTAFDGPRGRVEALRDVSLSVDGGEILGLVGESGSGKSLTGFSITGLLGPGARVTEGSVRLRGRELIGLPAEEMRRIRGRRISMVFQDPMMTLNPVLKVGTQMRDALLSAGPLPRAEVRRRCAEALGEVGIPSPEDRLAAYPHQLSGGMRQRVAIAIALLHGPELVIADEPTTALDVTIQGQILALVQRMCRERGTALVWITHDLAVVAGIADRIAVMYAGQIVEQGSVDDVIDRPAHPYTRGLIDSVPTPGRRRLSQIPGRMPALTELPEGCAFRPRCPRAAEPCRAPQPMRPLGPREARCCRPLAPVEAA